MQDDARRSLGAPSAFFHEHQAQLEATADLGPVLDLACGKGRHALAAADLGLSVVAVDRNQDALDALSRFRPPSPGQLKTLQADLESSALPPFEAASFGAVLVFRYLHRPLMAWIQSLIAADGVLLYETFTLDQRELGWGPTRDDFLLEPDELPTLFSDLDVQLYEEGPSKDDRAPRTARLLAVRKS